MHSFQINVLIRFLASSACFELMGSSSGWQFVQAVLVCYVSSCWNYNKSLLWGNKICKANNINSQLYATILILLIVSIISTCFGRWFRPSSGALGCVYSLWYNAPAVLPAGSIVGALYHSSCKHSLVLLRMGEIIARNMLRLLKLLIKWLFLHIVGCLYYCMNDAPSHKHQKYYAKFLMYG